MSTIWNKPRYHSPLNDTIALLLSEVQALTQALTDWSQGNSTAAKVRDAQGRMDKAYTKCIADFVKCEISMRNLGDLPEDLQELLGPLLSSEPTPEHLETYLPDIQSTTTRFIQDLHTKRREHYQRRRSTSSLCMDPRFELKRAQTLGSLVTDKRVPKQCSRCDGNVEGWTQYQREKALCCLGGSARRGRAIFEGGALKSDEGDFQGDAPVIRRASLQSNIPLRSGTPIQGDNLRKGNTPTKINTSPKRDTPPQGDTPPKGGTLSRNNVPPLSDLSQDSSSASTLVDRTPVPAVSNDIRALGRGEKYICATCGNVCIAPVQVAVDALLCASLRLLDLLEKWPMDRGLHVDIDVSYIRMSEAFDAAMDILQIRGIDTSDLMSIPNDLKEIIDRGLIIPHDSDFENLSAHVLADAGGVFEKLASGLKSRQREYKLKHSPAIPPSISRLLVCFKSLGQALISWSNGTMSEKAVSDVFITVDHAFETVISAFQGRGIDVSDLLPLPEKLRQVLKWTLAEVPTPDNWERHKPSIGAIVNKLLICVIEKDKDDRLTIDVWCPSNQEALDELDGDWSLVPPPLPAKVMDESKEYVQPAIIESSRPPTATFPTRVVLIEVPGLDPLASSATLIQPKQEDGMVKEKGFKRPLILSRLRERIALVFGPADAKYKKSMSRVDGFA